MRDRDKSIMDDDELKGSFHRRTEELYLIPDSELDKDGLIEASVLPLREVIVYPHMISPLFIRRELSLLAIEQAQSHNRTLIALNQVNPEIETPGVDDFLPIGVEMAVGRLLNMPDGSNSALVQARRRVEIVEFIETGSYLSARVRPIDEYVPPGKEIDAEMRSAKEYYKQCVELDRSLPEDAFLFALNIDQPGWLADLISTSVAPTFEVRKKILLMTDPKDRLVYVIKLLAQELDVLELEDEIQYRTQNQVDRSQREYYLREQMKVIQSELGEGDAWSNEISELRKRIESVGLPDEVEIRAIKEVNRLTQMPPISPEGGIIRTYIDWILELPWHKTTKDNLDVSHASEVLDKHHYGLKKPKERILEYIAVKKLKPKKSKQPILCFIGPPGTGKTSLGKSIADALGRHFVRVSLGGVRDEAEIRGHRRTYIGALPGRILQTMRRAETINPLFMLDEVDKLGNDFRGDPSAALLEVLDPEQNHIFSDHYLELPYDLSKVFFITTANTYATIPPALLDRMETIEFSGYIEEDKLEIATRFLIPRQIEENGLDKNELHFTRQGIERIIREYTYEAGVRNLEREIGRICRKVARLKAEHKRHPVRISSSQVERFLGPPQFFNQEAERKNEIGVATAVAWTSGGGEIMPVEVLILDGKGNLQITGQIGTVMQESIQASLSYLKSRANKLGIESEIFEQVDVHLHIPEGSIQKDGPSAGVTITTALASAFTHRPVRCDVGMTGEITLRGRILPVGGVKEKVLAAHRAGLKLVVLPKKNIKDLVDIPKKVKTDLRIELVEHMDQVLEISLLPKEKGNKKKESTQEKAPPDKIESN